ncbi:MAG: hypothetical protein LBM38_02365 [Clostridiales bacterium]|jgi:hypothetical protein|nr:hypothetical protein [Clostridiales bacterium]
MNTLNSPEVKAFADALFVAMGKSEVLLSQYLNDKTQKLNQAVKENTLKTSYYLNEENKETIYLNEESKESIDSFVKYIKKLLIEHKKYQPKTKSAYLERYSAATDSTQHFVVNFSKTPDEAFSIVAGYPKKSFNPKNPQNSDISEVFIVKKYKDGNYIISYRGGKISLSNEGAITFKSNDFETPYDIANALSYISNKPYVLNEELSMFLKIEPTLLKTLYDFGYNPNYGNIDEKLLSNAKVVICKIFDSDDNNIKAIIKNLVKHGFKKENICVKSVRQKVPAAELLNYDVIYQPNADPVCPFDIDARTNSFDILSSDPSSPFNVGVQAKNNIIIKTEYPNGYWGITTKNALGDIYCGQLFLKNLGDKMNFLAAHLTCVNNTKPVDLSIVNSIMAQPLTNPQHGDASKLSANDKKTKTSVALKKIKKNPSNIKNPSSTQTTHKQKL